MGKAGYVIFNAEGKKPEMTVSVIKDDKDIQVIFEGVDPVDSMMLIGIICNSMLIKTDISKENFFEALGVVMDEVAPITERGKIYEYRKNQNQN